MRPRLVAICGAPTSGKTTVAEFLALRYGAEIVDDGGGLRKAAAALYNAPLTDFTTQEGKAASRVVCGKTFTNRQLLGDLGSLLEDFYGQQFMPEAAIATVDLSRRVPFFIFPSCRKTQGLTYLDRGGIVIEVTRPGAVITNDFDQYVPRFVTHTIRNDGDLDWLEMQTRGLFDQIMGGE